MKLKEKIIGEIKKIYDPEIPVNIYELGLIYKIEISDEKKVNIENKNLIITISKKNHRFASIEL